MGLVSKRELAKAQEVAPSTQDRLPPVPVTDTRRVRMFHPDTTDRNPIRDHEFRLDGVEVKVRWGVAIVDMVTGKKLEAMNWRKGKVLCDAY